MLTATKIRFTGAVQEVRRLTGETIVLRMERGDIDFEPGQYVRIGVEGDSEIRDYSVYSGNNQAYLEVLLRRVEDGLVSKQLFDLEVGDKVMIGGPYGHFVGGGSAIKPTFVHCNGNRHLALQEFLRVV